MLLHAGGLEISHLLPDKPPGQFDLVFDVKANGWYSMLSAIGDMPVGATVAFSSIAGRFGNGGQTDYSAANDLLCKLASNMRSTRPDTRGIAIDWTAWGDIGMATRGSIPTIMKAAGIDMLPAAAGIPFIRRELTAGGRSGEVLVGQSLGILADDFVAGGGVALDSFDPQGVMVGSVETWGPARGLVVSTTLDPAEQPFLDDHRIDGTPVLPGVMGMEFFAQVASLPFPHRHVAAIEDIDFLAPFKFYRDEPRTLRVSAQYLVDGDDVVAHCVLIGERTLANQDEPQRTVHFTGTVRLSSEAPEGGHVEIPSVDRTVGSDEIYEIYFHGPAYQVLSGAGRSDDRVVGSWADDLPDNHAPADAALLTAPRLTELCFQTAGVWEIGTTGQMALPMAIDRVTPVQGSEPAGSVLAVVTPSDDGRFEADVVDEHGNVLLHLAGYRTVALPGGLSDDAVAPLRDAMTE